MKLEEEIFQKCIFNTHKLQKYGFTEKEGSYTASFSFLDGQFIAHLVFSTDIWQHVVLMLVQWKTIFRYEEAEYWENMPPR